MKDCSRTDNFDDYAFNLVAEAQSGNPGVESCKTEVRKELLMAQAVCAGAVLADGVRKVRKLCLEGRQWLRLRLLAN